jgi:hypothetical protein
MKIAHQPKSLLKRAIQVLAREALLGTAYALAFTLPEKKIYDIKWTAKNLPSEIQHHLVQHYSGNNLTECIAGHESIQNYQQFCISDDYFQNFLFHFFNKWESDKYCFLVERKLGGYWKKFQDHLKEKLIYMDDEETQMFVRSTSINLTLPQDQWGLKIRLLFKICPANLISKPFF